MSERMDVRIIEFVEGRPKHIWYGVNECIYHHHVHVDTFKQLLYTGNPIPSSRPGERITFDLDPTCSVDLVERNGKLYFVPTSAPGGSRAKEV